MCLRHTGRIACNMNKLEQVASEIRRFNRFYLPFFHLLTQKYLNSNYSMAEARIMYEIYEQRKISATDIVHRLHVDKGYLSRILRRFEDSDIIQKEVSDTDLRRSVISLTETGTRLAESLMAESNRQIADGLTGLSENDLERLTSLMGEIIEILEGKYDEIN